MRRFEYKDAKSQKFWEIDLEGDAFTVRYGKIGSKGQVQTKTFASEDKAAAEAEKLIKSKTKKGYAEVPVDGASQAQAEAASSSPAARNLELEAAIVDNPDDLAAWQVYFDWLQTQGDPWGERGNLALARAQAEGPAKGELSKQLAAFDAEHGEALYGKTLWGLLKKPDFDEVATIHAPFGLICTLSIRSPYDWSGTSPKAVLAAVLESPAGRLLHSINIGLLDWEYPVSLQPAIDTLSKVGKLENLRKLFIGDFEYPDEQEISWVTVGKLDKLLPAVPKLRSLHLRGSGIRIGSLVHPTLQDLVIETGGLPGSTVASIGQCKLPELTSMEVWLGCEEYGGDGDISQLDGLFTGTGVPKLRHLALKNCEWQDDIAAELTQSPLLAQLRLVDLSMGTMHDYGVEAIIANPEKYRHLIELDLSENFLSEEQVEQLEEIYGEIVDLDEQREADEWDDEAHYYTSVGE